MIDFIGNVQGPQAKKLLNCFYQIGVEKSGYISLKKWVDDSKILEACFIK